MIVSDSVPDFTDYSNHLYDEMHIRLLMARSERLRAHGWDHENLSGSHWRLYQNDAPGARLIVDGRPFELKERTVYLIPAGHRLDSSTSAAFTQFYVHFDVVGMPQIALRELFGGLVETPKDAEFEEAVHRLGRRIDTRTGNVLVAQCLVKGIVYEALGRYLDTVPVEQRERWGKRVSSLRPVLPAIQRIEEAPDEKLTIPDLAALCHMSDDHFIRTFRICAGVSPIRYVLERRVALAAQRLLFTDETIDHIASAVGFGNRYYFTRVFTRQMGQAPAAFRKGVR